VFNDSYGLVTVERCL